MEEICEDATWPYESARADLIADVRKHRASPRVIQTAIDACRRHLSERTINDAAQRNDDIHNVMRKAIAETIAELEREFSGSHDDAIMQALVIVNDVAAKQLGSTSLFP
ncbi:MAG: hypothetical protein JO219_13355 [Candidatus Eremiobacteraeota bacterium]|nr:hypothetical protein [Candidatus Eremiobacteraeota bacterium]MBV8366285.1 hypothetical protein [Candidatus Eremiobacteraeota bacterium]